MHQCIVLYVLEKLFVQDGSALHALLIDLGFWVMMMMMMIGKME